MRYTSQILLFAALSITLTSCWKEEEPWQLKPVSADSKTSTLAMGKDYDKVYFFNLKENSYKGAMLADWDLGFEAGASGYHTILNGGKDYRAVKADGNLSMKEVTDASKLDFQTGYDRASGNLDSTACGNWKQGGVTSSPVFVVDCGVFATRRYYKFRVVLVTDRHYDIEIAELAATDSFKSVRLMKNDSFNFVYLNFVTMDQVAQFEPHKETWDLQFTRYLYIYHDMSPPHPYTVTGVLVNPGRVSGYRTMTMKYEDIKRNDALAGKFSNDADFIGFEWKQFNQTTNRYTIVKDMCFIIKAVDGRFYKFRFTDFYDKNGNKGNPSFQYEELL